MVSLFDVDDDNDDDDDASISFYYFCILSFSLVYFHHPPTQSLLELLELPSLMDACVRSNLYDEALSIAGLANTLERRDAATETPHATNNNSNATHNKNATTANLVVQQVVEQIRQRQVDLQQQLWQRLSQAAVTLPDCLEVVTALRRLNAIELERQGHQNLETIHARMEVQLQMDFLQARDVWLDDTSTKAEEDLLDTMERYRTRVFEIATQFNAIFARTAKDTPDNLLAPQALLRLWMSRRVEGFLQILATARFADTSALRDATEAAIFFATSVGRLGADFTARLPPILEPALVQLVTAPWQQGAQQLQETLVTCREAGVATPLTASGTETTPPDAADIILKPPRCLLEFPPLARFVNALLTGLNELRRCLLPNAVYALQGALRNVLADVQQQALRVHERAVHVPGFGPGAAPLRQAAVLYQTTWTNVVEPYAWAALYAAVGDEAVAQTYWETVQVNLQPAANKEKEEKDNVEEDTTSSTKEKPATTSDDGTTEEEVDGTPTTPDPKNAPDKTE